MDINEVLDIFMQIGILVQEDAASYVLEHEDPRAFIERIMRNMTQPPLIMTQDDILKVEREVLAKEGHEQEINAFHEPSVPVALTPPAPMPVGPTPPAPMPMGSALPARMPSDAGRQMPSEVVVQARMLSEANMPERSPKVSKPEQEPAPTVQAPIGLKDVQSIAVAPSAKPPAPKPVQEITVGPEIPALEPAAGKKGGLGIRIDLGTRFKPIAKDYDADLKINEDVTGKCRCAGEVEDFKNYFLNRFDILRKILKSSRSEMSEAVSIARAKRSTGEVKVIGMVQTVSNTKNGHRIILLEDEEDSINLMINASNQNLLKLKVITDEVIGITGKINQKHDMIYLDEIFWPEIPMAHQSNSAQLPLSAAFISDIHLGSKTFLKKSWDRFLQWLSGKTGTKRENDIVSSIKYLVIAGDNVDGIGIYPGQYKDLDITDIYEQYESLAFEMERIPEYIKVIMMPGNHDAVRPNEPQPAMHQELCEKFSRPITFVGNPCNMSLSGVDVLAYHGRSLDDFVTKFDNITYETPLEAMKEMLNRRHMLPIYGEKTPIAPEPYDYMVIRKVPDIFVTGHVHSYGAKLYRGVICLNSSCWQSQTSYQKMMNFVPQPAKVPIVNLQTKVMSVMDFLAS